MTSLGDTTLSPHLGVAGNAHRMRRTPLCSHSGSALLTVSQMRGLPHWHSLLVLPILLEGAHFLGLPLGHPGLISMWTFLERTLRCLAASGSRGEMSISIRY